MKVAERIVAFFLLFLVCLVWPVLSIANRSSVVLGIPALVLYLFGTWAALVIVLVLVAGPGRTGARPVEDEA